MRLEPDATTKRTQFYHVSLACEAASAIGCGMRAKPILRSLEANEAIAAAWLHRSGTILAVRWQGELEEDQSAIASAFADEQCVCGEKVTDQKERRALLDTLARENGWYNADRLDELSKEEATVIAARVMERLRGRALLEPDQARRLTGAITEACVRVLTTEAPGTVASREERLRAAMLNVGRFELSADRYRALEHAVAAGHRPLPNER
jgi:hypothetical protein